MYRFGRGYRAIAEASAYRVQRQFPDRHGGYLSAEDAAQRMMSPRYSLGISIEEARRLVS